uniref:Ovule protein n=1 Tax=Echinococcus granulosus TaxID=6210 RepID=A0A068WJ27_ECHGR|nr:hypothetical protein EgrG_000623700 [Echinococcus granulosus]
MDFFHFHPFLPFSFALSRRTTHPPASINYTLSSTLSTLAPICKYIYYKLMLHSNIYTEDTIYIQTHTYITLTLTILLLLLILLTTMMIQIHE